MTTISRNSHDSEKWLEAELCRKVKAIGGKALKYASVTETGYPDRLVIVNGQYWWVELKSKGQKPRLIQLVRIKQLKVLGCHVWIIDSEAVLEEFMEVISNEEK